MMAACRSLNGIGGNFDVAIGAIFKANRRRQARSQLAMHLALGGASANGAPADHVANVLR